MPSVISLAGAPGRVLSKWGPVLKICGALPCLDTVAQVHTKLSLSTCKHNLASLPQAGKSLVYFETNLSAVFSERELTFTFAICYRLSVRLSVCNVRAPYSAG